MSLLRMDEISDTNSGDHTLDSSSRLDSVTVVKNDTFVQSVKTVYDHDSLLVPAMFDFEGEKAMVIPRIDRPKVLQTKGMQIRSSDYLTKIELLNFPKADYKIILNGMVVCSSKDNCFDLEHPKSKALDEFYSTYGRIINNYENLNPPNRLGLFAPSIDDFMIAHPNNITLPERCLVELTGIRRSELLKSAEEQQVSSWTIDITPSTSYNIAMCRAQTKYLVFKLPPDSWIKFLINGTLVVDLRSDVSANETINVIVNLRDPGYYNNGVKRKYVADKQLIDFARVDRAFVETNIQYRDLCILQGCYYLYQPYPIDDVFKLLFY